MKRNLIFLQANVAAGVKICDTLDILEEISDYQSDPFSPLDLDLPANSCKIACTKIQNFEEEESCASTVSVDHFFGSDMNLIGSDMILFGSDLIFLGSKFQVHKPFSTACSCSHQWYEETSTASLLRNCCWGFDLIS